MQHERYVGYEIKALSNLLRRRLWGPADHPQSMLTEIEGVLIGYLCHSQGREIYQKDLERALCIRSSTASRLLKRLEDEGLVQRSMGVRDARMKRITPTLRAQALNQEAERRIAATEATLTRGHRGKAEAKSHLTNRARPGSGSIASPGTAKTQGGIL